LGPTQAISDSATSTVTVLGNFITTGSGASTINFASSTNSILKVQGDVTIGAGTTFMPGTSTLSSSFTNNGTMTAFTGTILFNSTTTGKTISGSLTGSNAFYGIQFYDGGSGGAWTFNNSADVQNITISGGTVTAPSGNLTVYGDFINGGTFSANSGTVVVAGS